MSMVERAAARLREMLALPANAPVDLVVGLGIIADKVVRLHAEREMCRALLCAIAFDYGLGGGALPDLGIIEFGEAPRVPGQGRIIKPSGGLIVH